MTSIDLDELERLAKAATPGPWKEVGYTVQNPAGVILFCASHTHENRAKADAEFITAANPFVVLHLLESIKTLMDDDSILAAGQRATKSAIDSMVEARKERDVVQAAYAAVTAALADVEVPIHLDKGQPCLDRIAALKAQIFRLQEDNRQLRRELSKL